MNLMWIPDLLALAGLVFLVWVIRGVQELVPPNRNQRILGWGCIIGYLLLIGFVLVLGYRTGGLHP